MAFEYTMTVRLSPYWNKVGTYFVKGKHFLTDCGVLDAVTVSIYIENGTSYVYTQVYIPFLQIVFYRSRIRAEGQRV